MEHGRRLVVSLCVAALLQGAVLESRGQGAASPAETVNALRTEIDQLRRQIEAERQAFEARIGRLEERLAQLSATAKETPPPPAAAVSAPSPTTPAPRRDGALPRLTDAVQSLNPEVSAIIDVLYHSDNAHGGIQHVLEEVSGFGHSHGGGGHDHAHGGIEDGFNLRHVELQLAADIDPYFRGSTIVAVSEHGAELETAEIETSSLPWGLKLRGGKFYSDFGYINAKHSHEWDFVDRPLIYQLTLGDHGLNDKGLQLSWLAPAPFFLLLGAEVFQGGNEMMFAHHGDSPLPSHDGPRLGVGWIKVAPHLPGNHGMQLGLFAGTGRHQEEHDGNADDVLDHWLDGRNTFYGADLLYKCDAPKAYGEGDFTLQGEYFARRTDLELVAHDLRPALVGNHLEKEQDGYYIQAVYGFLPRWRAGVRWEQVGLTNEERKPSGPRQSFGSSHRAAAMLDFNPSEFSRLRVQVNRGDYAVEDGREEVTEVYLQWVISLGAHGAHKY